MIKGIVKCVFDEELLFLPVYFKSKESFIKEFELSLNDAAKNKCVKMKVLNYTFGTEAFAEKESWGGTRKAPKFYETWKPKMPEILTLEEWFQENYYLEYYD